jgi:hypothetical protein
VWVTTVGSGRVGRVMKTVACWDRSTASELKAATVRWVDEMGVF